jgi:hypothetical protein
VTSELKPNPSPVSAPGSSPLLSESRPVGPLGTALLGVFLLLLGLLLAAALFAVWPAVEQTTQQDSGQGSAEIMFGISVTSGTALIVLVIVASALGSYVHAATSFADFAGNRRLVISWLWWYILRVLIGIALALVFYFAVRGGLLAADATNQTVNPFGIAALAGLVGMFSKQATDKLDEVFTTAFRTAPGHGDDQRKDSMDNPKPRVAGVEPPTIATGSDTVTLRLHGEGFIPHSQVRISPLDTDVVLERATTFVNSTELTVVLIKEDLVEAGVLQVTVFNPEPGGGMSAPVRIDIRAETTDVDAGPPTPQSIRSTAVRRLGRRRSNKPST